MPEPFEADELAAEELDAAIDSALATAGGEGPCVGSDPVLYHLAVLHQAPLPPDLASRITAHLDELATDSDASDTPAPPAPWAPPTPRPTAGRPLRLVAAAFGLLLTGQAAILWLRGPSLANFTGHAYEPHIYTEQAIAYLAIGIGLLVGSLRPSFLRGAVPVAASAGVLLGLFGLSELPHAVNPAAEYFHFLQAGLAVALGVLWWKRPRP